MKNYSKKIHKKTTRYRTPSTFRANLLKKSNYEVHSRSKKTS